MATAPKPTIQLESRAVADLLADPSNARTHSQRNIDVIRASLRQFGQQKNIVILPTGVVIAGSGTLAAAHAEGWERVDVKLFTGTLDEARAYGIVDNRSAELAEWEPAQLAESLQMLDDLDNFHLDGLGFTADEFAALAAHNDTFGTTGVDPDEAPPEPTEATTKLGDVWLLGPHRLLVGDCRDQDQVLAAFGDDRADCLWTDPPYGVDYVGGNHAQSPKDRLAAGGKVIGNDTATGLPDLLKAAFTVATAALKPGAPLYVAHPAGFNAEPFRQAVTAAGWLHRLDLVWVKNSLVMGRTDYHYKHEPIIYGFTPGGEGRLGRGGDAWFGDDAQTTVFEVDRPQSSKEHPTMKPVDLIAPMLRNSCKPGGLVYDPFAGSGSTLIAAHTVGCRAFVVELAATYADVICARFGRLTGQPAVNAATGSEFPAAQ